MTEKTNDVKTTEEADDSKTIIGLGTGVRIQLVLGLAAGLAWGGWVTSELNTIKTALVSKTAGMDGLQGDMKALKFQVDLLEKRGSEPMQQIQKSVDKLAEELRVHQATTEKFMKGVQ